MIRKKETLLALAGVALFVFVVRRIGWSEVIAAISKAWVAVAVIVGLSLIRLALQSWSWMIALRLDRIRCSLCELMFARLACQGIGYLSVLGPLASEPMRIGLLQNRGASPTTATLADTGVYWFVSGIVGVAGCFSAALLLSNNRHSVAALAIIGVVLVAALFLIASPTARLSPVADALGARRPRWIVKAQQVEDALRNFKRQHPQSIRRMLLLGVACQALLAGEVVSVLWTLKIPIHIITVLAIEGATRAIKIMAGWMPARIGADESGVAGAFFAFGLSPASGLTLALARRLRDLLAALVGLSWLAWKAGSTRAATEQTGFVNEEEKTCKLC
jgi:Lysylphosphatidylglycerol synthase TM region